MALLVAVFATNVYRAATQGIIIDEAFTYTHFVEPPLSVVMTTYDVNHHVLNSLLAKVTTGVFGLSELTLRMPALLGGLIYLVASRWIVLRVFAGAWSLMAFALLTLNPFVLDYLSAARGYGMALGFLMCALWFLLERAWYRAGIFLGLAACANLSFLYPIAGFLGAVALVDATKRNVGILLDRVVVPIVVLPFFLYVMPLSHADPKQFAYTTRSLHDTFREIIEYTFNRGSPWLPPWAVIATEIFGLAVLAGGVAAFFLLVRKKSWTLLERLILVNGAGMIVCLVVTWLAHVTLHSGYPYTRTGVYWPVLLTLSGIALVNRFEYRPVLQRTAWALAAACLAAFLIDFEVGYYNEWKFDAGSKRITRLILQKGGAGALRIATSAGLDQSLDFYRMLNHAQWEFYPDPKAPADFYVLDQWNFRPELKLLYRDPVSEVVVMQ